MANPKVKYEITAEDKSKKVVSGVEASLKRAAKIGATALATASVAAAAGIATIAIKAAQAADNVGKLSTQLGISVKSLSQFEFIAGQTGVKFETMTMALQRSTRRIAEAAQGTGEAKNALIELGLSAQKLNQLDPAAQFEVLSKQLSQVTNNADQVRLAFKLFDSEGVRLLRTIKSTGGEFGALNEEARKLGSVLDTDLTKKAADVNDSMDKIGKALSGVGNSILNSFGPAIVAGANYLVDFIVNARKAAESIGLLDRRLSQMSLKELNKQWLENNQLIVKNEQVLKLIANSGGNDPARKKIIENLNNENEGIKKQIALLKVQSVEIEALNIKKTAAVVAPVQTQQAQITTAPQDKSNEEYQRYLDSLLSEEDALLASYARRIKIIEDNTLTGSDVQASLKQQEYVRLEGDMLKHQAKLGKLEAQGILARKAFEQKNTREKTKFVLSELASLTAGVAQNSKTMFKINKVAGIANAIISTYEGVAKALSAYPPPISFAMAGAQLAAGMAQVNAIRSTSFAGGGGGTTPSLAGSVPTVNNVPVETAPVVEDIVTTRDSVINISFNPGISDTQSVRDFIVNDLSEALRDGAGLDVRVVAQ